MRALSVKCLVLALALWLPALPAKAAEPAPYPRISEEAYRGRLPFFDYPNDVPLEGRVAREWDRETTRRQKIVFRGAQGFLVPGYLEFPKKAVKPYPLVLLLHGWSGSKEQWYEEENIVSGGALRKALLDAGYAVMALDAATHGERSHEIDYQHVNPFNDPNAPTRRNYFSYAEIAVQTVKDYRRGLDYLAQRGDVDIKRIGLVGYSMGGMDAFYLMAVEPRIKTFVACVPPLTSPGYGSASPIDYTWGTKGKSLLMLMGRKDTLYDPARVEASYRQYIAGPDTKILWYDQGHGLTAIYVPDALAWVKSRL